MITFTQREEQIKLNEKIESFIADQLLLVLQNQLLAQQYYFMKSDTHSVSILGFTANLK